MAKPLVRGRRRCEGRGLWVFMAWEAAAKRLAGVRRVDSEKEISPVVLWWISKDFRSESSRERVNELTGV